MKLMKNNHFKYLIGLLLASVILATSFPFSIFHHHPHETTCEVGLDLPAQFKKENDQAKHHYHTNETKCFICDSIFTTAVILPSDILSERKVILDDTIFSLVIATAAKPIYSFQNKAPPLV
jgi:hypothetical protein